MLELPIKNYLIVGSYAMGVRTAKDIDVVCYEADVQCKYERRDQYCGHFMWQGRKIELLFADHQDSFKLFLQHEKGGGRIAPYHVLFAIKAGHITYPHRQWEKHIMDYHILRKMCMECDLFSNKKYFQFDETSKRLEQLIKLHKESTKARMGTQRLPKLIGVSKEEFFDDAVIKYYDHDDIHQWFAHDEKPMYSYMQEDPNSVECSKDLWNDFSINQQLQCVMEECYVIASERFLILYAKEPEKRRINRLSADQAFRWALMRVCTTLCSGWFRQFAVDNYFNIVNNYNKDYPQILNKHL